MKKNSEAYSETLFQLINFRNRQYREVKSMIDIDYESFIVCSTIGAHYLNHNSKDANDWNIVWQQTRIKKNRD